MGMEEAVFAIEPGGPYASPTSGSDAVIDLWCNEDCDVLIIHNGNGETIVDELAVQVDIREHLSDNRRSLVVTDSCLKSQTKTVESMLVENGCLLIPPLRYAGGRKLCRVWAFSGANLTQLFHDLQAEWTVTIDAKRSIDHFDHPTTWINREGPSLSDRQAEAIKLAHASGYYEIPRQTTTAEIAEAMGIERRTAETHLRLAEQKIIDSFLEWW